jgi:hypothetical protein
MAGGSGPPVNLLCKVGAAVSVRLCTVKKNNLF